ARVAAAVGTARHRTAAQQIAWTVRSAASWRGGYSRLPARASTRDKRGCHLGRGQSRGPPPPPALSHGVVMKLKSLVSCSLIAFAAFSAPAHAQVEIQWWHAMGGALGEWVNDLAKGFNESQKAYK